MALRASSILLICDFDERVLFSGRLMLSHVEEVRRVAERVDECHQEETDVYVLRTARWTMKWRTA